jgi:hypothetical protein
MIHMSNEKIDSFNTIIDSFLEEGGNDNGEFMSWVHLLSWEDKNIVGAILLERFLEEGEESLSLFEGAAKKLIRRYQLQ